jgi:hypothetical protein
MSRVMCRKNMRRAHPGLQQTSGCSHGLAAYGAPSVLNQVSGLACGGPHDSPLARASYLLMFSGATRRDRTGDLLITNQPLYQLS